MPPTIHVTQYSTSAVETNKTESRSYFIIPCKFIQGVRVLETLYFPESKKLGYRTTQSSAARRCAGQARCRPRGRTGRPRLQRAGRRALPSSHPCRRRGSPRPDWMKILIKNVFDKWAPGRRGRPRPDSLKISIRNVLENGLPAAGAAQGQIC